MSRVRISRHRAGEWIVPEMSAYCDAIEASFPAGSVVPTFDISGDVLPLPA